MQTLSGGMLARMQGQKPSSSGDGNGTNPPVTVCQIELSYKTSFSLANSAVLNVFSLVS